MAEARQGKARCPHLKCLLGKMALQSWGMVPTQEVQPAASEARQPRQEEGLAWVMLGGSGS